jgi:lipoprotein-anchoring transpeptidase ErfK/SrfK
VKVIGGARQVQRILPSLRRGAALAALVGVCWSMTALVTDRASIGLAQEAVLPREMVISARIDELKQSQSRWIVINLSEQRLNAWEGDALMFSASVSTGRSDEPTPIGIFSVQQKSERAWMQGETYDVPNVPYAMFYSGNYAIHGAYWHSQFGSPISSGCINLPVDQAAWLFDWADVGTTVIVQP